MKRIQVACVTLSVALAIGCGEITHVENESIAIATRLADSVRRVGIPAAAVQAAGPETAANVYLDISKSMRGFVACRSQPTHFDLILDHLAVALSASRAWVFGSDRNNHNVFSSVPISRSLHCPNAYDQLQNPDYALFQRIRQDTATDVSVYVTDGVQSDAVFGPTSPSVAELESWIKDGHALSILAFESVFVGDAWSEARQRWISSVRVDHRPFYVFVFARTDERLTRTLAQLASIAPEATERIRFSHADLSCTLEAAAIERDAGRAQPLWLFLSAASTSAMLGSPKPVADYLCALGKESPVRRVGLVPTVQSYRQWKGDGFGKAGAQPLGSSVTSAVRALKGDSVATVVLKLSDDAATRFGLFSIVGTPQLDAIRTALGDLSTDDDSDLNNLGRTYRFAWLIERLARVQVERDLRQTTIAITTFLRE